MVPPKIVDDFQFWKLLVQNKVQFAESHRMQFPMCSRNSCTRLQKLLFRKQIGRASIRWISVQQEHLCNTVSLRINVLRPYSPSFWYLVTDFGWYIMRTFCSSYRFLTDHLFWIISGDVHRFSNNYHCAPFCVLKSHGLIRHQCLGKREWVANQFCCNYNGNLAFPYWIPDMIIFLSFIHFMNRNLIHVK